MRAGKDRDDTEIVTKLLRGELDSVRTPIPLTTSLVLVGVALVLLAGCAGWLLHSIIHLWLK